MIDGGPEILLGDAYLHLAHGNVRDKFVVCESKRGTGKTRAILTILLCRLIHFPGTHALICRSTRTRLADTVLKTLEEQVFPSFGIPVPGNASRMHRHEYTLENGSTIIVMGLDDPARTQSYECSWIYVAEATELGKLDDVVALAGALRQAYDHPDYFRQCIVDCNPGAPGHWLNQQAEPYPKKLRRVTTREEYDLALAHGRQPPPAGKWKRIVTQYVDNPRFFDTDNWTLTKDGKEYYEETLGHLQGHLRRQWLDGEWCAAEGAVFPGFSEEKHVVPAFEIPAEWPIYMFYDPGFDHPTGISWVSVAPNGKHYVIDEMKDSGRALAEWASLIKRREEDAGYRGRVVQRFGDPQGAFKRTPDGAETTAEQMRKNHGLTFIKWPGGPNEKDSMVEKMRDALDRKMNDGSPFFVVFDRCVNTKHEFQSWRYKRNPKGEQLMGDDQFEDANNDILDGLLGCVAYNLGPNGQKITMHRHGDEARERQAEHDRVRLIRRGKPPGRGGMRYPRIGL